MAEFNIRSDAVDVEQIMRQIRARIREKRGVDYTEAEIRHLASVKLERFLEPSGVRSDLLEQFHRRQPRRAAAQPNSRGRHLYVASGGGEVVQAAQPLLKLFFNPGRSARP
jgi:hypothetical protein